MVALVLVGLLVAVFTRPADALLAAQIERRPGRRRGATGAPDDAERQEDA